MIVWVVIFLVVVYFIGRACMRFLDDEQGERETMEAFARRHAEMDANHKARVERIQKQMDETRKHMEEW